MAPCGRGLLSPVPGHRHASLLLYCNLHLGPPVAQTRIAVSPPTELLTTSEEKPDKNQQASEQSFHAFPLHELCFAYQSHRESRLDVGTLVWKYGQPAIG